MQRKQDLKLDTRIKEVEKKKIEELRIQHHELEIQNIMNIVFILCMERLRNSLQMHAIHKHCEVNIYTYNNIFDIHICILYSLFLYFGNLYIEYIFIY